MEGGTWKRGEGLGLGCDGPAGRGGVEFSLHLPFQVSP